MVGLARCMKLRQESIGYKRDGDLERRRLGYGLRLDERGNGGGLLLFSYLHPFSS